jgi:hypothetical protein
LHAPPFADHPIEKLERVLPPCGSQRRSLTYPQIGRSPHFGLMAILCEKITEEAYIGC